MLYIKEQHNHIRNTLNTVIPYIAETRNIATRIIGFLKFSRLNPYGYFAIFGAFNILNVSFHLSHFYTLLLDI